MRTLFVTYFSSTADAAEILFSARDDGYDFVTTALPSASKAKVRADVTALTGRWWRTSVVDVVQEENISDTFFERMSEQVNGRVNKSMNGLIRS